MNDPLKLGISAISDMTNLSDRESPSKLDEEDEDEDIDFNPFLKEIPSPEASSSLSSEIEGLNGDAGDSGGKAIGGLGVNSSTLVSGVQNCAEEFEHGEEEVVMQTTVSSGSMCENEVEKAVAQNPKKGMSTFITHLESGTVPEKCNSSSCGIDDMVGELGNVTDAQKPIIDFGDEEAICKRTRARYSLASFTLDELETFLQETDDEDDLHNVDDEQEYRKFLASVLQGGDSNNQSTQENETADDDEDNDADFEIELEEALESDVDDHINDKTKKGCDNGGRRPETRQNRRQRAYSHCKKKLLSQTKRPLRPILPVLPNGGIPSFAPQDGNTMVPQTACPSSAVGDGYINGFAPYQVGQLHGLIHEHVQLLIQVFSLCVLDPSRQHIASQVQKLIFEMLHKLNEVLTWKTTSYPSICFCAPCICLSVPDDAPRFFSSECSLDSSPNHSVSSNNKTAVSERTSSKGRCEHASICQVGSFPNYECSLGVPHINRSLLTILDAAPLHLVGKYMEDVEIAVQESRRRHVETSCDTCIEKESLFPLSGFPITTLSNSEVVSASTHSAINTVSSSSSQQPPKKTLAATLVESTKKQSVALVPKEIAKLAERFFPLFNPALFPHKPPPAAVANRVLFTDSEDELLALGLMEYNTDWKAIQQRFLPCKSKHQIFVRQKNRCSSKAPENPIKVVRRMKTSHLTSEELACIQEGLKVYKHDWISIWRFIVPHRDPSLLPRQWRIAIGTQKSYKLDAAQKEKRRLYESKRRNSKVAELARCQNKEICNEDGQAQNSGEENNTVNGYTDDAGKSYVHEAFLADWRPNIATAHLWSNLVINPHRGMRPHEAAPEGLNSCRFGEATHAPTDYSRQFLNVSKYPRYPSFPVAAAKHSGSGSMESNNIVPHVTLNTSKPQFYLRPYRARKTNVARLVKLAPDLPPVNLPPSVRIVPQSAFKGPISSVSPVVSAAGGNHDSQPENMVPRNSRMWWFGTSYGMEARQNPAVPLKDGLTSLHTEESRFVTDKGVEEGKTANSDLQMHPLLFQAPEEGCLPYRPLKCSTSDSCSFSFFSGRQPHLNLSLLHNPQHENHSCDTKSLRSKESSSLSLGVDFHPLLQRTDVVNNEFVSTSTNGCTFVGSGGNYAQLQHPCDAVPTDSMKCTPLALGSTVHSTLEKANKLDLEIHLSSTSKKEKARGRNIIAQSKQISAALDSMATMKTHSSNPLLNQQVENSPNCNGIISGGRTLDAPANLSSGGYLDDMDEQSHPEIVMDQEELSDSDDENEENVEFECEEMADSEAEEESGYEQIVEVLNKEKKLAASDSDEKHCESSTSFHDRANFHTPRGNVPSLELGLASQGKDDSSNSSWLSIDSSAPHPSSLVLDKQEHNTINNGSTVKHLASTRPNRSCKKINPSIMEGMTEKQAKGTAQLNLGPPAIPILRKPRKRACRTNSSLNTGPTVDKSSCNG